MLKIGDFSRICQVTIKTLHHYDRLDLLKPAQVDTFTGHRYYSINQVSQVNRILALKDLGLSLDEIKQVFDEDLSPEALRAMLRLKRNELQAELESTQARLQRLDARLEQLNEEDNMPTYDVILKAIPTQRVLTIRQTFATAEEIAPLFAEVEKAIKTANIQSTGAWTALYHHEGFRDTDLDVEVAVPVGEDVTDSISLDENRELSVRQLAGYEHVATVIEDGHQAHWSGSYTVLGQFIEANHYEMAGAVREVYLTSSDDVDGWVIEIQCPLKATAKSVSS